MTLLKTLALFLLSLGSLQTIAQQPISIMTSDSLYKIVQAIDTTTMSLAPRQTTYITATLFVKNGTDPAWYESKVQGRISDHLFVPKERAELESFTIDPVTGNIQWKAPGSSPIPVIISLVTALTFIRHRSGHRTLCAACCCPRQRSGSFPAHPTWIAHSRCRMPSRRQWKSS